MEEAGTKLTEHSIRSVHRVFPELRKKKWADEREGKKIRRVYPRLAL